MIKFEPSTHEPPRRPRGRWGRIALADILPLDLLEGRRWDEVAALGARVFVVSVEHRYGRLEWLCLSQDFAEVAENEPVPAYDPWFERQEDGTVKFLRFERIP